MSKRFTSNRKYPTPPTVVNDLQNHTIALQALVEGVNIGQRRAGDIRDSFVRLGELEDVGLIEIVGKGFNLIASTGGGGGSGIDAEGVQDIVGAFIVAGAGISVSYDDVAGELTISASGGALRSAGASFGDGVASTSVVDGLVGYISVPYAGTITRAQILANATSTLDVEVWKAAGAIPTVANKISGTAPIALSADTYNEDTALTGWTTDVSAGDIIAFKLNKTSGSPSQVVVVLGIQP